MTNSVFLCITGFMGVTPLGYTHLAKLLELESKSLEAHAPLTQTPPPGTTGKQEVRLPQDELSRLKGLIREWQSRRSASKHQLQCVLGHLHHAASVVVPFTHHLLLALKRFNNPSHRSQWVRLSAHDLAWWDTFLEWSLVF